jgi:hypothetical protein
MQGGFEPIETAPGFGDGGIVTRYEAKAHAAGRTPRYFALHRR